MSAYSESTNVITFKNDLESRALRLISGTENFTNAAGTVYTNSANLYRVFLNAITVMVIGSNTLYILKSGVPFVSITQYLASLPAGGGTPAPAPAPVVRSNTVYLGDYVNINSQTNTVNLGAAKLIGVSDAVYAQDVPSYKQVQAVQNSLTSSLSTTNSNVTSVQNQVNQITAGSQITNFQTLLNLVNSLDAEDDANLTSAVTTLTNSIDTE